MDKEDRAKRLGFLIEAENMDSNIEYSIADCSDGYRGENDRYSQSSLGSSPPKDFNVNQELQYIPISKDDVHDGSIDEQSSSLASSLSLNSADAYTTSPVLLTSNCRIIRCPVCEKPMRTFYCSKCILKGQFVTLDKDSDHLETRTYEQLDEFSTEKPMIVDEQKIYEETLQTKLRTLRGKTDALKSLYESQKLKLKETEGLLKNIKSELEVEKKSNRSKEAKICLIKKFINAREGSVKRRLDAKNNLQEDIRQYVNQRVYQLTTDIFPIEQLNLLEHNNSFVNMETSPLLTFSDGSHHQIEQQTAYSIVEPWLPSNGDYSAYSLWINDNQDHIPASMSDLSERNPAFRIRAALSYATQLVNNLASYLDVILPSRLDLDVFNKELLNDVEFSYNVAKLNTNVIHLCISQGVDISLLNPQRTLKNLMLILNINISDIGRKPIIEIDNEEAAKRIVDKLSTDLSIYQESFYDFSKFVDEDDVSDSEWEISDTMAPNDMQQADEQSIQQNSYISRLPPLRLLASFWTNGN